MKNLVAMTRVIYNLELSRDDPGHLHITNLASCKYHEIGHLNLTHSYALSTYHNNASPQNHELVIIYKCHELGCATFLSNLKSDSEVTHPSLLPTYQIKIL